MPTLAWLSAETPDRHGGGGQRRQFHQIRVLHQRGIGVRVATLEGPQSHASVADLVPVTRFRPGRLRGRLTSPDVERFLDAERPDAAVVAHVQSLPHVARALRRRRIPLLVDFHNVDSRFHAERGEDAEAGRRRAEERAALGAAAAAVACSDEERAALLALEPGAAVEVAPHGIDADEWPGDALAAERERSVAFFGALGHRPNAEGLVWLAHDVWPRVRAEVPDAQLLVLGPGEVPGDAARADGLAALGRVDDLAATLGRVRVVAVPIVQGIGARVKFVEGLASGAAVVSTTVGAEGFEADGAYVRADTSDAFAAALVELLKNEDRARAVGAAGRELALTRYRWEQTTEPLVRFAERAAR